MDVKIIVIVLAVVVLLLAGTAFSAWRAERSAERDERENETRP